MQIDLLSGRRLRFELQLKDAESIPGAIARGVRGHVLVRTAPVLDAAGVRMRHAGYSQLASFEEVERLAYVIRCDPETLAMHIGERIKPLDGSRSSEVRFGDRVTPRIFIELHRRRIGPQSLIADDYHRLDWLNVVLPYCPESLERLVDRCSHCGSALGWHYSWGIGVCEYCRRVVLPSSEPQLPASLAEDYRLFAKMTSPMSCRNLEAYAQLPPSLQDVRLDDLVRMAQLFGGLVQESPVGAANRREFVALPASIRASVAARGAAILRSWPEGFQKWLSSRWDELQGDQDGVQRLRQLIIRSVDRNQESAALVDIVEQALPHIRKHAAHGLVGDRRYYLYAEVQKKLFLNTRHMDKLRHWEKIKYRRLNNSAHVKGQFDADQIEELEPFFQSAVKAASCAFELKLPHYAIEQLVCCGELAIEDHPAFVFVKAADRLRGCSKVELVQRLRKKRHDGDIPEEAVSLSVASKRIGGRLKPWGSIFKAMTSGHLGFWMKGDDPTMRSIFVLPRDMAIFDRVVDGPRPDSAATAAINQADAAEILNVKTKPLVAMAAGLGIVFEKDGFALAAVRSSVLEAAAGVAFDTEISWHLGVRHGMVEGILVSHGLARRKDGWCRSQLIEAGFLPPIPLMAMPAANP